MRRLPSEPGQVRRSHPSSLLPLGLPEGRAATLVIANSSRSFGLVHDPEPLLTIDVHTAEPALANEVVTMDLGARTLLRAGRSWLLKIEHPGPNDPAFVADLVSVLRPRVLRLACRSLWDHPSAGGVMAWQIARCVDIVALGRVQFRLHDPAQAAQWRFFASCCSAP